jgi:tetratricopeptide (TPR) repeat protein
MDEGKAPKKLNNFLYTVYAENALAQGKNALAVEYFKKRKFTFFQSELNTRLLFIEGQIYQKANEYDQATKCFKKTARRAGDYEMQFASNLNIAMCYDPKKSSSKSIISRLNKMAEDKKNVEYRDQVYYALGEVYFRDKNVDKACGVGSGTNVAKLPIGFNGFFLVVFCGYRESSHRKNHYECKYDRKKFFHFSDFLSDILG